MLRSQSVPLRLMPLHAVQRLMLGHGGNLLGRGGPSADGKEHFTGGNNL